MSNNIYDIIKKIESLEAPKKTNLTESKMATVKELHNESKKEKSPRKGSIAEAVARVEKQLSEKFHGYKKAMNETEVEESGLQAYLGKKKYGETGMKALQKAGREGASKEKMAMIRAKHDKMDEAVDQEGPADLLAAVEQEINNPGRTVDNLTDVLNATFGSDRSPEFKKARAVIGKYIDLVDNAAMGSEQDGIAPMRGGNIARHIQQYDLTDYLQHAAAMLDKAVKGPMSEASYNEDMLSSKQKKIASMAGDPDKIDAKDFAALRGKKKGMKDEGNAYGLAVQNTLPGEEIKINGKGTGDIKKESKTSMREGWEEMQKYLDKKRGPESKGGAGKKAGTRYGGSAQKDDDEETDDEGKPVEKKKGRPKGTGGGAKHSFKKPKD